MVQQRCSEQPGSMCGIEAAQYGWRESGGCTAPGRQPSWLPGAFATARRVAEGHACAEVAHWELPAVVDLLIALLEANVSHPAIIALRGGNPTRSLQPN